VIAAFEDSAATINLAAAEFGLGDYETSDLAIRDYGACNAGFLTLSTDGWPGPNEGTSLLFNPPRHTRFVELCWFAAYAYAPVLVPLGPNPATGRAGFATNGNPPLTQDALGLGATGFGTAGHNPVIP